jgi:hypothetical protein
LREASRGGLSGHIAEIVNLRTARKARARADAAVKADANRAKFGRSKVERLNGDTEASRRAKLLDGVRRGDPDRA